MKKLVFLLVILMLKPFGTGAQDQNAKARFYEGVVAEEVTGELDKALSIYQELLKNSAGDRQLAAKCLYHIGLTYEKKGSDKALGYYADLLEKYPDQADLADLARGRIAKLKDANTFIDPRDGHKYKWVKIGNQVWMAENLAYMPWVNPPKKQEWGIWMYDYDGEDVAEAKATENYQKYGCLYDWTMAMDIDPKYLEEPWNGNPEKHQGICPPGWHMPTDEEWKTLEKSLGMSDSLADDTYRRAGTRLVRGVLVQSPPIGRFLKSSSGWNSNGDGDGSSGFNILPGGDRWQDNNPTFSNLGYRASFWTSTGGDSASEYESGFQNAAWFREFGWKTSEYTSQDDINRDVYPKTNGYSVRCIKNDINDKSITIKQQYLKKTDPVIVSESGSLPTPIVAWSIKKDKTIFPPIVSDGILMFACMDSFIYAYDYKEKKELWKLKYNVTKEGSPRVAESDGYILFALNDKLVSLKKRTGDILWSFPYEKRFTNICTDSQTVYGVEYGSREMTMGKTPPKCKVFALKLETGEKIWETTVDEAVTTKPATDGNIIVFGTSAGTMGRQETSYCFAINCKTGAEAWRFKTSKNIISDPFICNDISVFGCTDNYVYAVNNSTGEKIKRFYINGLIFGDPIVKDNEIYIGAQNQSFYAFDLNTGFERWRFKADGTAGFNESSVYLNGQIITGTGIGLLYGIDSKTGNPLWKFNVGKGMYCHPIVYDNKVIITSRDGWLHVLEPVGN